MVEKLTSTKDISLYGRVIEKENKIYKVKIQGVIYTIKTNFSYDIDERVLVLFPEGKTTDLYLYPNK